MSNTQIIQTTIRSPSDNTWSWSLNGRRNNNYTDEEFAQYREPYWNFIESTQGFVSLDFYVDEDKRVYTITYDTVENTILAQSVLFGPSANSICLAARQFAKEKRDALNITYTYNTLIPATNMNINK